ncbi:MAG: EAL domain-containing response regulator [Chloroflexota bacterium]
MTVSTALPIAPRLVALDDDPVVGAFVADVARRAGFDVDIAESAETFRNALRRPADVVTVDLLVPGTDGVEVLRDIAQLDPSPEVVIISGLDERVIDGARRVALDFGLRVRGQVQKPFRASDLRDILAEHHEPALMPVRSAPTSHVAVCRDELRRAILHGELVLQYQPQISLATGEWLGAEALVRWQHPVHGLLQPGQFLDLADDELLASELTVAVMRTAAAEWAELGLATGRDLTLSVNLHPLALADPGFAALVLNATAAAGLPPERVVLEVTEVAPTSGALALSTLTRLRMRGFGLSIDDFGTGHSSLERLSRVPFTELKVDRGFVMELGRSDWARTIAAQSVTLAKALGLRAVAEGIEDEATMAWLRGIGCDAGQGFGIARPMWIWDLVTWGGHPTAA